jgi:hypothetical protein
VQERRESHDLGVVAPDAASGEDLLGGVDDHGGVGGDVTFAVVRGGLRAPGERRERTGFGPDGRGVDSAACCDVFQVHAGHGADGALERSPRRRIR